MIAYLTDIEGRWEKLASFCDGNPLVRLDGDQLQLADGARFVFGGDAVDRGPAGRRVVTTLLAAKRAYPDRVTLLAGNRDINKLRLTKELTGAPPEGAPGTDDRAALLRWIFANTMGAPKAFDHRATELGNPGDAAVVQSYLDDVAPDGPLRAYLHACQLGVRIGATLFLHGGVTTENFGVVPGMERVDTVESWLANLETFYRAQLADPDHEALIAYQRPVPGTHENQESVVYARPTDDTQNPHLPPAALVAKLRAEQIFRVVVGHTPNGDSPAILPDDDFELVLADNSYGRLELGTLLLITDDELRVRAQCELDDGRFAKLAYTVRRGQGGPLGKRDPETGELIKAPLGDGWLIYKGLPEHRIAQLEARDLDGRALVIAR